MNSNGSDVNWSQEQWQRVTKAVDEEAQRARVAASFLPLFGPVDSSVVGVPNLRLGYSGDAAPDSGPDTQRMWVDSDPQTLLTTIAVTISLRSHEVADGELSAALAMFRRAANVIARVEDALLFHGQTGKGQPPAAGVAHLPRIFTVSGGRPQPGLLAARTRIPLTIPTVADSRGGGDATVSSVVQSVNELEARGHMGPYACVLGHDVFTAACTPTASLVLPRDRILPFLNGPLVRSSSLPADSGLLIALGGGPVEIVVGSDIAVRFIQTTPEPRYLFRLSERVALRVKEWSGVAVFDPKARTIQIPDEPWEAPAPPAHGPAVSGHP
jgi:uncharacterized linocin/CFP29 family protein